MADVSLKEAFDIYQKQSDSLHKLWTYLQVVSIAVLGYTVGTDKAHWGTNTYVWIGASYLFFALANLWVVVVSQRELEAFGRAVAQAAAASGAVGRQFRVKAMPWWAVAGFHVVSIAVVLGAIVYTWKDKCIDQKATTSATPEKPAATAAPRCALPKSP